MKDKQIVSYLRIDYSDLRWSGHEWEIYMGYPLGYISLEAEIQRRIDEALAAAKKRYQAPNRVLTPEDIIQMPTDSEGFLPVYAERSDQEGVFATIVFTPNVCKADYGKTYRCWLRNPTAEERSNTPWEE